MARPARVGTAAALLLGLAAAFAPVPRQRAPLRAAPLFAKETLQDKIYAWQDQFIAGLTKDDKAKTTPAPAPAPDFLPWRPSARRKRTRSPSPSTVERIWSEANAVETDGDGVPLSFL